MEPSAGKRRALNSPDKAALTVDSPRSSKRPRIGGGAGDGVNVGGVVTDNGDDLRVWRELLEMRYSRRRPTPTIAVSSQNIVAACIPGPGSKPEDVDRPTISFSLISPSKAKKPRSWTVCLQSKTQIPSPPAFSPASIDLLLFSDDGTRLFVASHLAALEPDQAPLRLTVLAQGLNADAWKVIWDEVVFNGPAGALNSEVLAKRIVKAHFLGRQRRWIVPPQPKRVKDEDDAGPDAQDGRARAYREPGRGVDSVCAGRGVTLVAVLNTHELFVLHFPSDPKTHPHILMTPFPAHKSDLPLTPTPSSLENTGPLEALVSAIAKQPVATPSTAPVPSSSIDSLGLGLALSGSPGGIVDAAAAAAFLAQGGTGLTPFASGIATGLSPAPAAVSSGNVGDAMMHLPTDETQDGPPRETGVEITHAAIGCPIGAEPCVLIATRERLVKPLSVTPVPVTDLPVQDALVPDELPQPKSTGLNGVDVLNNIGSNYGGFGGEDDYLDIEEAFSAMMPDGGGNNAGDQSGESQGKQGDESGEKEGGTGNQNGKSGEVRHVEPLEGGEDAVLHIAKVTLDFSKGALPLISLEPLPNVPLVGFSNSEADQDPTAEVTHLDFIHAAPSPHQFDIDGPSSKPLCLMACFASTPTTATEEATAARTQIWNVWREPIQLSIAFAGLDCKKGTASTEDRYDWVFAPLASREFGDGIVLSVRALDSGNLLLTKSTKDESFQTGKITRSVVSLSDLSILSEEKLPFQRAPASTIAISSNTALCCALDRMGRIRSWPFADTDDRSAAITTLASAVLNLRSAGDVVRLITEGSLHRFLAPVFADLTSLLNTTCEDGPPGRARISTHQPIQLAGIRLYHQICSVVPGREASAELALKVLELSYVTTTSWRMLEFSDGNPGLGSGLWQYVGFVTWQTRLCADIMRASAQGSPNPHLCLLATVPSLATLLTRSSLQLAKIRSFISKETPNIGLESDLAKTVVEDAYASNGINAGQWLSSLEKIRTQLREAGSFDDASDWSCSVVKAESAEAVSSAATQLREIFAGFPDLKPPAVRSMPVRSKVDILTRCSIPPATPTRGMKMCLGCEARALKDPWQRFIGMPGRFEACAAEFARVCPCGGAWVSAR